MGPGVSTIWRDIIDDVRRRSPDLVRAWFEDLSPARFDRGVLEVGARNDAQARYLEAHCRAAFVASAQAITGRLVSVQFVLNESEPVDGAFIADRDESPNNRSAKLNSEFTFDNFVIGPCNQLAHAAAIAAADDPGRQYNPLFLHGPGGTGKTHLLQAICHGGAHVAPTVVRRYLTAEAFIARFTGAFESGALDAFRGGIRGADILLIDEVQMFAGRARSQEELFHTLNSLIAGQKQVVLAADRPPSQIVEIENRLASRFSAGLVVAMDPPCLETRLAMLKSKVRLRCIEIPDEALQLVAQRITCNGLELDNVLLRLDRMGQKNGGRITMDLVGDALTDSGRATASA